MVETPCCVLFPIPEVPRKEQYRGAMQLYVQGKLLLCSLDSSPRRSRYGTTVSYCGRQLPKKVLFTDGKVSHATLVHGQTFDD